MIPTIVGSLIYTKKRRIMDVFSPKLRELWNKWELRVMVLLSLILQIVLITLGNRRKYHHKLWLRIVVWSAYLTADSVATVALGIISNKLGDIDAGACSLDTNNQLIAFWAPFLLLHLAGPDTITAYALEDNELWLRHFLGLAVQTAITFYIFFMAWANSHLSYLTLMMIFVGLIKYGERTWVLWSASNNQFRDSLLTPPDSGPNYPKFMDEYNLKKAEGYNVIADEVIEVEVPVDLSARGDNLIADVDELLKAHGLLQTFKRLFVNLILSFHDRDTSQSIIKNISSEESTFKVIEIELGFMYDLLYTKAMAVYTPWGLGRRLISFSFTCFSLVIFSLAARKHKFPTVNLSITFLLLAVAILLEIYATLVLLSSDWTDVWLSKQNKELSRAITSLQLPKSPRWSTSMAQFSLISFCFCEKPMVFHKTLKLFRIHKKLEKYQLKTRKEVTKKLKILIIEQLKEKLKEFEGKLEEVKKKLRSDSELRVLYTHRGTHALEKHDHLELDWSTKVEFDQSILIWHIATELCYHSDSDENITTEFDKSKCKISKHLSRYMLYLLVKYPFMLPMGIGQIRFRDTCAEAIKFFEERISTSGTSKGGIIKFQELWTLGALKCFFSNKRQHRTIKSDVCTALLKVNTDVPPSKVKGDRSKSVLFDGCRLASALNTISDKEKKWEMISKVWVEMVAYAASQCRGNYHSQQLRRGGELLTHVWLLMAHFGITEHFQISQGHARAKLVVK